MLNRKRNVETFLGVRVNTVIAVLYSTVPPLIRPRATVRGLALPAR